MSLTQSQALRLNMLRALVLANVQNYDHASFINTEQGTWCALGLAVQYRNEYFPDLPLVFNADEYVVSLDTGTYACVPDMAEEYFGAQAYGRIFGLSAHENRLGRYPTGLEVAEEINRYLIEEWQCAAKQPVGCSTPMEPVARN